MADLATLQVKIDAAQAIRDTQRLGDALKQTAQQGPLLSAAMGKTEAEVRRFQQAEIAAYKEADRMAAAMKAQQAKADELSRSLKGLENQTQETTDGMRVLRTAIAAIVGSQIVRETVAMADGYKLVTARLGLVTSNSEELLRVQEKLFASAQRTRSSYEDVAGLYVRVARNMKELGRTEGQLLRFTELVNMQLQIAGATTQEAASGVMQLGQALSKGKLDGDEFRTVLEAMPTVADALTESLAGGVRAELFKLAEQGKITGRDIVDAILNMERETREKFVQMPKTVSQAYVTMRNDIMRAIAEIDVNVDGTSKLAKFLRDLGTAARFLSVVFQEFSVGDFDKTTGTFERSTLRFGERMGKFLTELEFAAAGIPTHADAVVAAMDKLFSKPETIELTDYVDSLAKLSELTALSQDETRSLLNADIAFSRALEAGNLSIQKRIELLERQGRVRTALATQEQRGMGGRGLLEAFTFAEKKAKEQGAEEDKWVDMVRKRLYDAWTAAEEQVAKEKAEAADRELAAQIERDQKAAMKLIEKDMEREKFNEQLADNFRENMQRALGDFFTEFVTKGKISMREMFDAIKQTGGQMAGQGISTLITGMMPRSMGPFGSVLAGLGLVGLGGLFGSRNRTPRISAEERLAQAQNRYASIELLRQQRAEEMRKFVEGRNGGRGGVIQSVGTVLQETTASRMIGELVAIRVATTRTADAVAGGGNGMSGAQVNVTVQGGMGGDLKQVGADVAAAVDRLLGTRVQALRLTSGAAVTT